MPVNPRNEPLAYCNQNGIILNILSAVPVDGNGREGEVISADKRGIIVACGSGAIKILQLQPAGGKVMKDSDYVNGRKIKAGDVLD